MAPNSRQETKVRATGNHTSELLGRGELMGVVASEEPNNHAAGTRAHGALASGT